jgi:group I intron endonuclease
MRLDLAEQCLNKEIEGLEMLRKTIHSNEYLQILDHLSKHTDFSSRIIITGVGKNSNIAEKAAATFASLGIPVLSLNTSHCAHGDYGLIGPNDTIIHISRSGNTAEMLEVIHYVSNNFQNVTQILIHCNSKKKHSECDYELWLGDIREGDEFGLAPTSTTTAILCVLDTLAVVLSNNIDFTPLDFFRYHPGGNLGASFNGKVGFIYKTTNLVNNKIYVGQCSNDPKEKYLGSGVALIDSIKKYGKENFKRVIIEYSAQEDLDWLEQYWIEKLDATNPKVGYNLDIGGQGGWDYVNSLDRPNPMEGKNHTDVAIQKMRENRKNKTSVQGPDGKIYASYADASRQTGVNVKNQFQYGDQKALEKGWRKI